MEKPSFLECLTQAYIKIDPTEHIETMIDIIEDKSIRKKTRKKILSCLDKMKNNIVISKDYLQEIELIKQKIDSDSKPIPPQQIMSLLSQTPQDQKYTLIITQLQEATIQHLRVYFPFYLGEILYLYKQKTITEDHIQSLFETLRSPTLSQDVNFILQKLYESSLDTLTNDFMHKPDTQENIAGDWYLFMQDHSSMSDSQRNEIYYLLTA